MVKLGLLVRLEARPGNKVEVESFLRQGLALVQQEPNDCLVCPSSWTNDIWHLRCFSG